MVTDIAVMKKIIVSVFLCLLVGVVHATPATVGYVIDGDTFAATVNLEDGIKISVRVRILDIDTPELSSDCPAEVVIAERARDRLRELLPDGVVVDLRDIKDDKYLGRIDARVFMGDGRNVSDIMLQENLARRYNGGKRTPWCK